mmetsp:Transcript_16550/g.21904  ORF Transcript_16550/g.21904 Transcript_16550/m.21904 type:complete len:545 (+) Transcript_16550:152-1786(+)
MTSPWFFFGLATFQFHLLIFWQCFVSSDAAPKSPSRCPFHPTNLCAAFQSPLVKISGFLKESDISSKSSACTSRPYTLTHSSFPPLSSAVVEEVETSTEKAQKKKKRKQNAGKPLEVHVIGLSHHNAAVDVREKLAVPEAQWNEVSQQICEKDGVQECALLSTCNRFEVYVGAHDTHEAIKDVVQFLCDRSGISQRELRQNLFMLTGQDAAWHLLRVSGGLDSLVVGEGQILSQVRQCYLHGIEKDGMAGKVISRMLNTAVAAGKRVRAETAISRGAVSISSAAVEFCDMKAPNDLGKEFLDSNVCIVGAGTMSRLLATHMGSLGVTKATLVNRNLDNAKKFCEEYPDISWDIKGMDELWEAIEKSDIVYTSTAATECILTEKNMKEHRTDNSNDIMLVDISVPRNVEKECDNLPGVNAYSVDDLKQVVARNTAMRRKQVLEAEDLLQEELQNFLGWQQSLDSIPAITQLQKKAELMRADEIKKVGSKLSDLDKKQQEAVQKLSKGIVNKLLHGPMTQLRAQEAPHQKKATLETVKSMFDLQDV